MTATLFVCPPACVCLQYQNLMSLLFLLTMKDPSTVAHIACELFGFKLH